MTAVFFTLALFVAWWLIGLAVLAAVSADTKELRVALIAPVVGTAVTVVPLFVVSNLGIPMETGARPVCLTLAVASLVVLAIRRPRPPFTIAPVLVVCIVNLVLVGRPMFRFGFNWIANANTDMAYYVLSATSLLHRGLLSPVNVAGLLNHRDFASTAQALHQAGVRAGTDITLSGLSSTTGLSPTALYMPMALSLSLCGICAVGALALQSTRRWWGATLAAVLLAASPLAAYGVLQQLMPQVWGLALATALAALLMRPEMHSGPILANLPQYVAVWLLAVGLFVVYIELAASLSVAYGLYVLLLAVRRRVSLRAIALLWTVTIALSALVLNTFLSHTLHYVTEGARNGINGRGGVRLFGYSLVPSALPGITGIQRLSAAPSTRFMSESIVVAALYLAVVLVASGVTARKGVAASIVVVCDFGLGLVLAYHMSDFGLFKLYMYAQPFLAAAIAVFLTNLKSRPVLAVACVVVSAFVLVQVHTQTQYVDRSFSPIDLVHASESDLLPAFRSIMKSGHESVISATDNDALDLLEGASASAAGNSRLYFLSRDVFGGLPLKTYRFRTAPGSTVGGISFHTNPETLRVLSGGHCTVVMSTGSQVAVNRRLLPEGSPDLMPVDCAKTRNLLVFTASKEGQPFSLPENLKAVSFWPLERDPSFPGHTLSSFGRYALFTVLGPTSTVRVALDFTTSYTRSPDGSYRLPPASAIGATRAPLPVVGTGSARVISPPLHPQMIGGIPYIVLDMGESGAFPVVPRPGVAGLWGKSVLLDPRLVTSSVRDVSLMTAAQYRHLTPPAALRRFPDDLGNPDLEYSGIFEDGWVGTRSYAVLSSAHSESLAVRLQALPRKGQHLDVLLDGKTVASKDITGGEVSIRVHAAPSQAPQRVELRFTGEAPLRAPDQRSAAALIEFLGFTTPPSTLSSLPSDLADPSLDYSGIFKDGWLQRDARITLAGGAAGHLTLGAEVTAKGQHIEVSVNGQMVASRAVAAGTLKLRVPIPASSGPRTVRFVFTKTAQIAANDPRQAAALLQSISVSAAAR
jgi:hypothetical protein